jgi:ArsR family transcriptional regulator
MRPSEIDPGARRLWQAVRDQASGWPVARQDELRLARRLAERREASQAYFARSASRWDRLRRELYGAAFGDAALRGLLPRDWIVADLACGTGAVAAHLAPHVARVVAVDHSPAMLRAARKRVAGLPNVDLRTGELERLPLETACCDAVLLLLALSYVSDPALALAEAARVSKPAGRLVVVDLLRHDREDFRLSSGQQRLGFDPEEMTSLIRSAGFSPDHSAPLPPEPEAKGPALLMTSAARTGAAVTPGPASPRAGRGDKERKKKS